MAKFSFTEPWYLLFLFLIPLFLIIHFINLRAFRGTALKFANFEAIARIKGVDFFSKNISVLVLSILISTLLTFSLSGLTYHTIKESSENSFVIAIDSSQSMEAIDFFPNRLEAAKKSAEVFVDAIPSQTKVGIISFSGNAYIERDLIDSKISMKVGIREITLSEISGTDILEAVITGSNILKSEDGGVILLISDGQINVGSVAEAVDYANRNNVIIHTVAIGTEEGGETRYGISKLDIESLEGLAYNTQGSFFRASKENELEQAFREAITFSERKVAINLRIYSLLIALVLFGILYFLVTGRFREL